MASQQHKPTRWQRLMQRIAASRPGAWLFSRVLHYIDRPLLRISKGRLSVPGIVAGLPVVMLTTMGAKSGQLRTQPVLGIIDADKVVVFASNWGRSSHPAWYHNLRANREAQVSGEGRAGMYVAHEATGAERERYWQGGLEAYRGLASYERRAHGRLIPVVVLTPKRD